MALNIGSMLVKAKFEAGNMMSGLGAMNSRFKESQLASKNATTQFSRMKGSLVAMGASAALTSGALLGMLMNAIMKSPFLAAAFEKLKVQMMLFGNAIARHLAPVLEGVINFIKRLREKFEGLPEPIQAAIIKFAAFGIIILGLISTLGILGIVLGGIKTGLATLGITSLITKLGILTTAIGGSTLAMITFGILGGLALGAIGVVVLEKTGVLNWFETLGEKIAKINAELRDLLTIIGGLGLGVIGGGIRDIVGGDFDFTHAKSIIDEMERAKYRLKSGTSETMGYDPQTYKANLEYQAKQDFIGSPIPEPKTKIESQNNYVTIDMSNIQGDFLDPATQLALDNYTNKMLTEYNEILNP